MDGFRFILENPHPNASNNKQRKRARLVTACDSCRVKKIKCQQPSPNGRCEACKSSKTPCLFGDRDRYQAERGVSCTWNTPAEEAPGSPETSSRKRKMTAPSPSASDLWTPASASTSAAPSRSGTPAGGSVSNYRYFLNEQRAGPSSLPSFVNSLNIFPGATHSSDPSLNATSYDELPLFDPTRPRFPHPRRMCHLGALFFDNVGAHFPFLDRYDVLHRIEQRTCSAILSNVIAGLAVRFTNPARPDPTAAAPFYDMAKTLAAHVVSVPSVEALHALICITWVEYGAGHDDGFWRYSRMAIAMCLDLGLGNEATIQVAATSDVRHRLRLTWWMVVCVADIAASWATGRPCSLDLELFDTELPSTTDDASLLFRNIVELFVIRGKLTRVLEVHVENYGDSSLDWDLAELKADLKNISKELPPLFVFNEANLTDMHNRRLGHVFVQMHLLIHGVSALLNRPSLLPSYGLPVPTEGPRAEAARSSAKALVDVLMVVEDVGPHVLRDPFMDLPILVASRAFIAENEFQETIAAGTRSSQSNELTRQWSETFLIKCKEFLARISSAYGSNSSFEAILHRHGGTVADDPHFPHSSPVIDGSSTPDWSTTMLATPPAPFAPPHTNSLHGLAPPLPIQPQLPNLPSAWEIPPWSEA
ncbi:hypothetical protein K439DRAFT_168316 [Ramaria rubella]|nr:hypothetical protein K439DRAFT_168316 [Ramaria rubella]